ncbi:CHAD domain-containing protein [Rubellicoccus peritrichatus]|uniref:CHAD domain-containing protein n=1 Tax=Rubellicoccus peritrichatus TaxID=3080537 RepID=A0AAQ3QX68_9BACT|nr:CHAD domain-containing protein [Puniceicoccus sp. CR14]WOO43368.1 CHAD domain-containing protein [Puniceicoccus sp. CR14]
MKLQETYILPDHTVGKNLLAELKRVYPLKSLTPVSQRQTSFDSFDWRLYQKGYFLIDQDEDGFQLRKTNTDECWLHTVKAEKDTPQFWWDFPKGKFQKALKDILDVRAVLPLAETIRDLETYRCLNSDSKTVLRLHLEDVSLVQAEGENKSLRHALQIESLRGYESEVDRLKEILDRMGVFPESRPRHFVMAALEAIGKRPFDYSSKIDIKLNPLMSSREAARIIHRHSFDVMCKNEEGMLADIDSEFLHDFRVAVRRTRSALSLVKGVFPQAQVDRFKNDFSYLGRLTNKMRDLDVYLLKRERYRGMLPGNLRPGLDLFFEDLSTQRTEEYKKFVKNVRNGKYKSIMKAWNSFLENNNVPIADCPNAELPVINTAQELIAKRFRKIYREGLAINDLTPEERLHELRIDFKKLRYLIEFFRSLYPAKDIAFIVKKLRRLQGVLGDLNDLFVQQETLNQYLSEISPQRKDAIPLAASIGVLVSALQREKDSVRTHFSETFSGICDKKFAAILELHFGGKATSPLTARSSKKRAIK